MASKTLSGHSGAVRALTFHPNNQLLFSASSDKTVKIWDVTTGQVRQTLSSHTGEVYSVALSFDGKLLASGAKDKTVKLWRCPTSSP